MSASVCRFGLVKENAKCSCEMHHYFFLFYPLKVFLFSLDYLQPLYLK